MAKLLNQYNVEIVNGSKIESSHIKQFADAFTGEEAYDVAISGSLTVNGKTISEGLNGTNYVMVYGTGTPEENAAELQAAYNEAKKMPRFIGFTSPTSSTYMYAGQTFGVYIEGSPKYYKILVDGLYAPYQMSSDVRVIVEESEAKSTRTTVIVAPGYYNFTGEFVHYCPGINIKSLSGDSDVYIFTINPNGTYVFGIETDFTEISGLVTTHATFSFYGTPAIRVAPNLQSDLVVKKCISGAYSFWDKNADRNAIYYGTFIDCEGGAYSFVGGTGSQTFSGKCIRCKSGSVSFGAYAILANATFEDCEGQTFCFGSTDGEGHATVQNTAIFKNCWAINYSFGFGATTNQGKYYYCINTGANSGVLDGSTSAYCLDMG
jgi:hypothetical protein